MIYYRYFIKNLSYKSERRGMRQVLYSTLKVEYGMVIKNGGELK